MRRSKPHSPRKYTRALCDGTPVSPKRPMGGSVGGGGSVPVPDRKLHLNPNWACLQKKISNGAPARPRPRPRPRPETPSAEPVLRKRKERPGDGEFPDAASAKADAVLAPVSDDCSVTDELALDCEMVGVGIDGRKNALGRVTLVNSWGNIVYDEFVHPLERVVDFRTDVSGIRPWNLKKAKDFRIAQKKVSDLLKGKILVGHALHNDLKVLMLTHPKKNIRDTSEYQPFLREGRRIALRHLASENLGIGIQQKEHCPIEDARAVMLIYQKHKIQWEKSIKAKLKLQEKLNKRGHRKKRKWKSFAEPSGTKKVS